MDPPYTPGMGGVGVWIGGGGWTAKRWAVDRSWTDPIRLELNYTAADLQDQWHSQRLGPGRVLREGPYAWGCGRHGCCIPDGSCAGRRVMEPTLFVG
jgi:hypothetical protein